MNENTFPMYDDHDPVILAIAYHECQQAARDLFNHGDDLVATMMETPQSESALWATANGC